MWHRMYAMLLRHFYISKQSPDRISEVFFWPFVDILIWGLTSVYFANVSHFSNIVTLILSALILWTLVFRGQQEIPMALLEELWNKNLINIFTSPLTLWEWVISSLVMAVVKTVISIAFMVILALLFYNVNFFHIGLYLIPFILLLLMTAWSMGFFVTGLILRYSTKVQTLAWSLVAVISPFTGVYYSISILPKWAQDVATVIPTSYVFEGMREVVAKGSLSWEKLLIAFILNSIYLTLSIWYFKKSFEKVLEKGLVKVY